MVEYPSTSRGGLRFEPVSVEDFCHIRNREGTVPWLALPGYRLMPDAVSIGSGSTP